ncbi:hypothetical protein P4M26_04335 [Pseudomonas aeruginosa]|nr:hypothetical protein [Pseudomonas aeruginosa]
MSCSSPPPHSVEKISWKAMSKLSGANCRVRSPGTPLATRNCHWV